MKPSFLQKLDAARDWVEKYWNQRGKKRIVFIVNSGYRTPSRNKLVGGNDFSSHPRGYAADIKFNTVFDAFVILIALALQGFSRFGISTSGKFIHVDNDPAKSPSVWGYASYGILSFFTRGLNKQEDV